MDLKVLHTILVLTFFVRRCGAEELLEVTENEMMTLYNTYREALAENELKSYRRVFINNVEYQMHVSKLKDVNGLKLHNLLLRTEFQPNVNKTIYINNPLESKLPHPFLSFDEFKQTLTDRIQKQKDEVRKDNLKAELEKARMTKTRSAIKSRSLRTIYFIRATDTPYVVKNKKEIATSKSTNRPPYHVSNKLNVKTTKWVRVHKTEKTTKKIIQKTTTKAKFIKKTVATERKKTTLPGGKTAAKITKSTVASTKKKLILRSIQNPTTRKPLLMKSTAATNLTSITTKSDTTESITETNPAVTKGVVTAKDSKETNAENIVPSRNETTESVITHASEIDTTTAELETSTTTVSESEATETQTEETTTTISTRATLGRPAVYMGR